MFIQQRATYAITPQQKQISSKTQQHPRRGPHDTFGPTGDSPPVFPTRQQMREAVSVPEQSVKVVDRDEYPATQQDRLGEKHYRPGAPERYWLHPLGEPGERFWMPGKVRQTNGEAIPDAKVEFWVANDAGAYSSEDFSGRGWQKTGKSGNYQLHCVRPGASEEKSPAFINLRVTAPGFETLSTRLFFEDDIHNRFDPGFDKDRELELGSTHWGSYKFFTASKDFVLKASSQEENGDSRNEMN